MHTNLKISLSAEKSSNVIAEQIIKWKSNFDSMRTSKESMKLIEVIESWIIIIHQSSSIWLQGINLEESSSQYVCLSVGELFSMDFFSFSFKKYPIFFIFLDFLNLTISQTKPLK